MKINKILLTLAFATVAISQLPQTAYAKNIVHNKDVIVEEESEMNFSDVSPNHWAYGAIKKLVEEYGVIGGFPDGTFRGNRNLTRYEAAAMIAKVMEKVEEISGGGKTPTGKSELDRLKKEFMTELEDLQSEVKKLSKDQQDLQKDLDETKDDLDMVKDMMPKVHFKGDATVRYELKTPELNPDKYLINAPEVRLRMGLYGENNGGFSFGTRISTSLADDITNQFVSLGDLASKVAINLDQLYVAARPWDGALDLTLGKHEIPFVRSSELLWDNNVNLDGAYLKLRFGDKDMNLSVLGDYSIFLLGKLDPTHPASGVHRFIDTVDGAAGMLSAGVSGKFGSEESVEFKVGANYHQFTNVNNLIGKTLSLNPRTNYLTADGKSYVSNFQIITGTVKAELFENAFLPVGLHIDVAYNLGAGKNSGAQDTSNSALRTSAGGEAFGMVAGVDLGKMKESGNFMVAYDFKMVGTDSVFSAFNEDQLDGTNVLAHEIKAGFQMAPMTSLFGTLQLAGKLTNPTNAANPTIYTLRLNLMQSF